MNTTLERTDTLPEPASTHLRDNENSTFDPPPLPGTDYRDPIPKCAKRILIADDDLAVRHMLARVLEGEKFSVILAKDGQQAISKFLHTAPDLVLLDLNMPDKDGWQAFEVMERSRPLVPIIIITARPDQYGRAAWLGIDAIMEKPLNLPVLLEVMRSLLAESDKDRVQRLTDPGFTTRLLNAKPGAR